MKSRLEKVIDTTEDFVLIFAKKIGKKGNFLGKM